MAAAESEANLSLAKRLAHSSDKDIRDAAFSTITTWLDVHKTATLEDYLKLWKALFYCVWYSDKVPVQQELIFNLSRLMRQLHSSVPRATEFIRAFFQTMLREWMGLDHHRLDKYMSLIRRMVHECIVFIRETKWAPEAVSAVTTILRDVVLSSQPNGIRYHVVDVFIDEIGAAVPSATTGQIQLLLTPFLVHCIRSDDKILFDKIVKDLLSELLTRTVEAHASTSSVAVRTSVAEKVLPKPQSPLLVDAEERDRALSRAFKTFALAPLAKDIFSIAALSLTQQSHREALYALRKQLAKAAVAIQGVSDDKACIPSPVSAVTPLVAQVAFIVDPKFVVTVEETAPVVSGSKRKFRDSDGAVAVATPASDGAEDGTGCIPSAKRGRNADPTTDETTVLPKSAAKRLVEKASASARNGDVGGGKHELPMSTMRSERESGATIDTKPNQQKQATSKVHSSEDYPQQKGRVHTKEGSQKSIKNR